jgi:hypothetical protein
MHPRADASPFLHEQNTAEKIGLHIEPIEVVYVACRINLEKMHGACSRRNLCTWQRANELSAKPDKN